MNSSNKIWTSDMSMQLVRTMADITDVKVMQDFLRDVMTEKEITEIAARLEAARMLNLGKKYTEIIEQTKLSSRTIARISEWLQNGTNGYSEALKQINMHHGHLPPARD
jgi:TrpR-related protein YerC/YecD